MQEVEITCPVTSALAQQLEARLAGRQPERVIVNNDRYYDTQQGVDLFRQAVFARVRETGDACTLQFKFDEPESAREHIACTERAFPLTAGSPLPDAAHDIFARFLPRWRRSGTWAQAQADNDLQVLVTIHNTRHIYTLNELTLCLDRVEGLGTFLEVEQLCEEGEDTGPAQERIRQFVADLGGEPLTAGYVELALREHRPQVYQRGLYHLA